MSTQGPGPAQPEHADESRALERERLAQLARRAALADWTLFPSLWDPPDTREPDDWRLDGEPLAITKNPQLGTIAQVGNPTGAQTSTYPPSA